MMGDLHPKIRSHTIQKCFCQESRHLVAAFLTVIHRKLVQDTNHAAYCVCYGVWVFLLGQAGLAGFFPELIARIYGTLSVPFLRNHKPQVWRMMIMRNLFAFMYSHRDLKNWWQISRLPSGLKLFMIWNISSMMRSSMALMKAGMSS